MSCVPRHIRQRAGLVCWYNRKAHFFAAVTADEHGRHLVITSVNGPEYREHRADLDISGWDVVHLRANLRGPRLRFSARGGDNGEWLPAGPPLDASILSDDYGDELRFTGTFVGVAAQDTASGQLVADFCYFEYQDECPLSRSAAASITQEGA